MAVTLKDIAEHLNLSVSTISRVLTGKDRVDPETRRRVEEALKAFNYTPNEIARGLKGSTSRSIGVIVPVLSCTYFAKIVEAIEQNATEAGYSVFICTSEYKPEKEKANIDTLYAKRVNGMIISTVSNETAFYNSFFDKQRDLPIVFFNIKPNIQSDFNFVSVDNAEAAYRLTQHLVDLGHRRIAIISAPFVSSRADGYLKCLKDNGIQLNSKYILWGAHSQQSGYALATRLMKNEEPPTAIIATNANQAYGTLQAAWDLGLKVPDDLSLACFDAIDETGLIRPRLTMIKQPCEAIGRISAETIIRHNNNTDRFMKKITVSHEFVLGDSTAPPRNID